MQPSICQRMGRLAPAAICVLIAACAGNGEGLDANGRPIGENPPPGDDDFTTIQNTIFTPACTVCHAGAQAPLGLRLDAGNSYAMLVDVPSVQVPALRRVAPGDPDNSYLVHKVEGSAALGGQMPLDSPPLDTEQINLIRQWIAAGAQPPPAALASAAPVQLVSSAPASGELLPQPATELLAVFSRPVDPNLLLDTSVTLTGAGGDGGFEDGNETSVAIRLRPGAPDGAAVWIGSATRLPADDYKLRFRGSGPAVVADLTGDPIDGDGDGAAGGDAVVQFRVTGEAR